MKIMKTAALLTGLVIGTMLTASADVVLTLDGSTISGWTKNTGTTTTLAVQDDTAGIGDGSAIKYSTTGKNNMWAEHALGQTITLGVNDYISLAMDVRFTGTYNSPPTVNNSIRWMFMTTADVMTGIGVNPGVSQLSGSWFVVNTTLQGSKFASTALGTTAHNVSLTLTRKDDGAGSYMQYSFTLDGNTVVKNGDVIASPTTEFSFDALQLGSTALEAGDIDGVDGILYDNITVTTSIPEPATIGMLGLGALLTLLARRLGSNG